MPNTLEGHCVLVVEDDWILAAEIEQEIKQHGGSVLGPAPSVALARAILQRGPHPAAAIVDIELLDGYSYPIVDDLRALGCPVVFASGLYSRVVEDGYRDVPLLTKPIDMVKALNALQLNGSFPNTALGTAGAVTPAASGLPPKGPANRR